jgi:hypothetical protein
MMLEVGGLLGPDDGRTLGRRRCRDLGGVEWDVRRPFGRQKGEVYDRQRGRCLGHIGNNLLVADSAFAQPVHALAAGGLFE